MGCHTWCYRKVTDPKQFEDIISLVKKDLDFWINCYSVKDYSNYINDIKEQYDFDKSLDTPFDENSYKLRNSNGDLVYIWDISFDENKELTKLSYNKCIDEYNTLDKTNLFELIQWFKKYEDILSDIGTLEGCQYHYWDNSIWVEDKNLHINIRIFGYPCDRDDNPIFGWCTADSLIEFLEDWKTHDGVRLPYWYEMVNGSYVLHDGYTNELYGIIRKFFGEHKNVLIHFG